MSEHNEYTDGYDIPVPRQPAGYGETRTPEGKGDDQGDHETPTPAPTTDGPSPSPSTSPTPPPTSPSPSPSSDHPTEPATTTSTATHTGDDHDAGLPVTSGPDAWVGATLVLCALLALVGGAAMTRAAKRIGTRP